MKNKIYNTASHTYKAATFLFLFITLISPAWAQTELAKYQWTLEKNEDNCKTYSSPVAGKDYIASKAVCDIPARIEVLTMIINDIENFPNWMSDCVATKRLKNEDEANMVNVFWLHQHIPILKDRDMVLRSIMTINQSKKTIQFNVHSTKDTPYDSGKSLFRMLSFYNLYELEWIDREKTRVTFLIDPDLGPGLPVGFTNSIIKKVPLKSMMGLMAQAKEKKYLEVVHPPKTIKIIESFMKL